MRTGLVLALALAVAFPAHAAEKCPRSRETTGYSGFTLTKYYACVKAKAAELERSGEDARTVAVAAETQCPLEFQIVIEAYDECFGRNIGTDLAPEIRSRAVAFATGEVVKLRASRP